MKLRIVSVGVDKSGLFEPAVDEYARRIRRYAPLELVEVKPSRKGGMDPLRAREEEGQALLARVDPRTFVVAMDERGELLDSIAFSRKIVQEAMSTGRDLAFLIGGAEGHADVVRKRANAVVSLSPMTLAHRLARLVLAEQIYRAFTIARGEPYHK